jgi:glyoxylase-like metal-dependent hydrolase (beta-lactamase superfamily II)
MTLGGKGRGSMAQLNIGDFAIDCVVDLERPFLHAQTFFPDLTDDMFAHCRKVLPPGDLTPDGRLQMRFQSLLVRTGRHTILIDTCCGNHKDRPGREDFHHLNTNYIGALAQAGVTPEQVDFVMCTHLHWDHVGWNTRLIDGQWVPTFPNARYIFGKAEFDYWAALNAKSEVPPFADSVLPVVEANKADIVADDFSIGDHARILPTPGHTPGHIAIAFGTTRDDAVFVGDAMHSPLQTRYPELSMKFDVDPQLAATTRRGLLERLCDTGTLCCTAHFPSPSAGRIKRRGDAFTCEMVMS